MVLQTVTPGSSTPTRRLRPRGIPTTYRDTRFRSRLEARWAAFFDMIGWEWIYEPFDADGWIPDFLLPGPVPTLVEVGDCIEPQDYEAKAEKPLRHSQYVTIVLGVSPLALGAYDDWHPRAGLLTADGVHQGFDGPAFALWAQCARCSKPAFYHPDGWYVCRPCGDYEGDHYLGPIDGRYLHSLWAKAGNVVQWRSR